MSVDTNPGVVFVSGRELSLCSFPLSIVCCLQDVWMGSDSISTASGGLQRQIAHYGAGVLTGSSLYERIGQSNTDRMSRSLGCGSKSRCGSAGCSERDLILLLSADDGGVTGVAVWAAFLHIKQGIWSSTAEEYFNNSPNSTKAALFPPPSTHYGKHCPRKGPLQVRPLHSYSSHIQDRS